MGGSERLPALLVVIFAFGDVPRPEPLRLRSGQALAALESTLGLRDDAFLERARAELRRRNGKRIPRSARNDKSVGDRFVRSVKASIGMTNLFVRRVKGGRVPRRIPFGFAQGRLSPRWRVRAVFGMTHFWRGQELSRGVATERRSCSTRSQERKSSTPDPLRLRSGRLSPRWRVRAVFGMTHFLMECGKAGVVTSQRKADSSLCSE